MVEDRLGPALPRAQDIAVAKAAAGRQPVERVKRDAPLQEVAHVDILRLKARAHKGRGHLEVAVDALLAKDRELRFGADVKIRRLHGLKDL